MRISSIFVLASRLKEDTEESKRRRKKADSDEDFEIMLFWSKITGRSHKRNCFVGYINVGDGCWRPNVLVTSLRC